jgi:hypothetical protein
VQRMVPNAAQQSIIERAVGHCRFPDRRVRWTHYSVLSKPRG